MEVRSGTAFEVLATPLMSIGDHCTRLNNEELLDGSSLVVGGLLGQTVGTKVTIGGAFAWKVTGGVIDREFLDTRHEQMKIIFPQYELIGWYHVLNSDIVDPVSRNIQIHDQVSSVVDAPAVLVYDIRKRDKEEMRLLAYESVYEDVNKIEFREAEITIQMDECEKIVMDDVNKSSAGESPVEVFRTKIENELDALSMLSERIETIKRYLDSVTPDNVDYSALRSIHELTTSFSAVPKPPGSSVASSAVAQQSEKHRTESELTVLLGLVSDGLASINRLSLATQPHPNEGSILDSSMLS